MKCGSWSVTRISFQRFSKESKKLGNQTEANEVKTYSTFFRTSSEQEGLLREIMFGQLIFVGGVCLFKQYLLQLESSVIFFLNEERRKDFIKRKRIVEKAIADNFFHSDQIACDYGSSFMDITRSLKVALKLIFFSKNHDGIETNCHIKIKI